MEPSMRNRKQRATSSDYLKHWVTTSSKDAETDAARHERATKYDALANDFYDNSTDFYLEGWGQSFHFCRFPRGKEPMAQCMARHEHYLAHRLGLEEGMTVLDVGCGVGGPAKEIATFVGCKVVGKESIKDSVVELVRGDFMKIPYPDNTFDAVYAIEATVHAPSLQAVYTEISRVLKPGGRFGVYEWVTLGAFDPSNQRHLYMRHGIQRGNGIAAIQSSVEAQAAITAAGLRLEAAEDMGDKDDPLPWWYIVAGEAKYAQGWKDWLTVIRMTRVGRVLLDIAIRGMELLTVAPKGTAKMAKELIHGDCIAEGGKLGLFTPMYLLIGKKPE